MEVSIFVTDNDVVFGDGDGDEDGQSQSGNEDPDFDFEGGPLFTNGDWVAYPDKDKNGNWFLRVRNQNLPGMSFQLFVNNGSHDGLTSSFNKLVDHFNEK